MGIVFVDSVLKNYSFLSKSDYRYYPFEIRDDLDSDCERFLQKYLFSIEDVSLLIIPAELNNDYIECSGFRLAHHIRLSPDLNSRNVPIIFLTDLNFYQLSKFTNLSRILLSNGVSFVELDRSTLNTEIEAILLGKRPQFSLSNYLHFCEIENPVNYDSHHSIANEWALFKLFKSFENPTKDDKYYSLESKINELPYLKTLHLKSLNAKNELKKVGKKGNIIAKVNNIQSAQIVLIDDEFEKGWDSFFNYIISNSGAELTVYRDFEGKFSSEDLIKDVFDWINKTFLKNNILPIFLIDLRLHTTDFVSEAKAENLSGFRLMQKLKDYNPGLQVICSTASNKIWNKNKLSEIGVQDIFLKEDPSYKFTKEETKYQFTLLARALEKCYNGLGLYYISGYIVDLKKLLTSCSIFKDLEQTDYDVISAINGILDQISSLIKLGNSQSNLNQIFLKCFHIIELYADSSKFIISTTSSSISVVFKGDVKDVYKQQGSTNSSLLEVVEGKFPFMNTVSRKTITRIDKKAGNSHTTVSRLTNDKAFNFKMSGILYFRFNVSESIVNKLLELRYLRSNLVAHHTGNIDLGSGIQIRVEDIKFLFEKVLLTIFDDNGSC